MARTFAQKVRLSIADPWRAWRSLRYRAGKLSRWIVGLGDSPIRLEAGGAALVTGRAASIAARVAEQPLMRDARTYNPAHPDFHPGLTRSYPGRIFNRRQPCGNPVFASLSEMAWLKNWVPDRRWGQELSAALAEASTVPGAEQVFERRRFVEGYLARLEQTYGAHYQPGWVNFDDALFLYWLVRRGRPKTIVQTGVCNGLSSAFMMLALAKNGPEGSLHVIDLPPVFDPGEPGWTAPGELYGVTIPEGKTTGWLVPDAYRDRFTVRNGDAKDLLPSLIDELDAVDFFYHDSDHTYDHMMFEFRQAKRKLRRGGLIVGDDISWNTSLWDFADEYGVPAYNFKGTIGVAFF